MGKLNIAGEGAFPTPGVPGAILRHCKDALGLEGVGINSKGSKIIEKFLREDRRYLAVSCDSFVGWTTIAANTWRMCSALRS